MTYPELQIQLDLNPDNRVDILDSIDTCRWMNGYNYLFVDSEDGQCYLFDKDGQEDDISKVKSIGHCAFENCISLKSIKIPSSVKWIGNWAFDGCTSLTSIKISSSIERIGCCAFAYCTSLKELVFENKTINQVKAMDDYPWGIEDESVIKYKPFI